MKTVKDLTGQRFGRLVAIEKISAKGIATKWLCMCDCGKKVSVLTHSLISGNTSSCGCLHREKLAENNKISKRKHGMTGTRLYRIWGGMKRRCYEIANKDYERYGARGIIICDAWLTDFQFFYEWAMSNGYKDDLSIDRIENDGNYEPSNCKWTTVKIQNNNRRTNHLINFNGKTQNLNQWADELGINRVSLRGRISKLGWSIERALTERKVI